MTEKKKTRLRVFKDGTPRISNRRERRLWMDGFKFGFEDGVERGRKNEWARVSAVMRQHQLVRAYASQFARKRRKASR